MKAFISVALLSFSLLGLSISAQADAVEKQGVTTEVLAGKTFVVIDSRFGATAIYLRKDGTFKVCGLVQVGCDEGTWSFSDGKVIRIYKTWFASSDHRTSQTVLVGDGKKGEFGSYSAEIFELNESLPSWVYEDPRK